LYSRYFSLSLIHPFMTDFTLTAPVALIIFNRPETTERVFEEIRRAKPTKLYVIADGPRAHRDGEAERCAAARAIIDRVDWDCEVIKRYSDVNLGCKGNVSSGITWFFEQEEEGIILEDDCVPHPSFFRFCQENLERYRHDTRIARIAGANYRLHRTDYSYYFCHFCPITGWATWRRTWQHYDVNIRTFPEVRDSGLLRDMFNEEYMANYWTRIFESTYRGEQTTWDYQLEFAVWTQGMLSIIPNRNLITNIGFGAEATHITDTNHPTANVPLEGIEFPLQHPPFVMREKNFDKFMWEKLLRWTIPYRIKRKFRQLMGQGH
jgi:hypothetical protein